MNPGAGVDELIIRLQERIRRSPAVEMDAFCVRGTESGAILGPKRPNPPLRQESLEELEHEFGFRFPTLVRRLYTEVADGGYGPSWGINRLRQPPNVPIDPAYSEMMSIESWYRRDRIHWQGGQPPEYWPHPFIRFCESGCNIFIGVDCSSDQGTVVMYDPNLSQDERDCLVPVADSVAQWLSNWLDEKPWPESRY